MTYNVNSQYKGKVTHPKSTTDSSVTYIVLDYITEGVYTTIYNINREVV